MIAAATHEKQYGVLLRLLEAEANRLSLKGTGTMDITAEQRQNIDKRKDSPFNVWLDAQVNTDGELDLDKLYSVAEAWGITKRFDHLNPGQQRMDIGNLLRPIVPQSEYGR
jgi:hypothetical protein